MKGYWKIMVLDCFCDSLFNVHLTAKKLEFFILNRKSNCGINDGM